MKTGPGDFKILSLTGPCGIPRHDIAPRAGHNKKSAGEKPFSRLFLGRWDLSERSFFILHFPFP
ncbi:MAG: hypothetical protein DRH20_07900 [Deltaproteobacteria bacterium]|nr:MAG: hypothetical protein DRH20_07900 [Deltaproteobacteria bacterium]